jgi:alcohol dehydrogenase class IV
MSSDLLACTCLDALTHAIEAFVSNANSPVTDIHALEAIRLISCNLLPAIQYADQIALSQLMLGSLEAGLAFSNAILGAVHSMAHSLGGLTDLPHGECNIVFLKHVIAFNYGSVPERYHRIGEAMGLDLRGMNSAGVKNAIINQVTTIQKLVGLDRTLGDFGLRHDDISHLARNALRDPCLATNPRPANRRDLEVLYAEAF